MNSDAVTASHKGLQALPLEVRTKIYDFIAQGSRLSVEYRCELEELLGMCSLGDSTQIRQKPRYGLKVPGPKLRFRRNRSFHIEVSYTSRQFHQDYHPRLARGTAVFVTELVIDINTVLLKIEPKFRANLGMIISAFPHTLRYTATSMVPRLRRFNAGCFIRPIEVINNVPEDEIDLVVIEDIETLIPYWHQTPVSSDMLANPNFKLVFTMWYFDQTKDRNHAPILHEGREVEVQITEGYYEVVQKCYADFREFMPRYGAPWFWDNERKIRWGVSRRYLDADRKDQVENW